jgi:hypothetical protein
MRVAIESWRTAAATPSTNVVAPRFAAASASGSGREILDHAAAASVAHHVQSRSIGAGPT